MEIRSTRESDLDAVAHLVVQLYEAETPGMLCGSHASRVEVVRRLLAARDGHALRGAFVADDDGEVVAFGAHSPADEPRRPLGYPGSRADVRRLLGLRGGARFVWGAARLMGLVCAPLPPDTAQLHSLVVSASARGRGLGDRLCRRIEEEATGTGHDRLLLYVLAGNPAVDFYRRHGYEIAPTPRGAGIWQWLHHPGVAMAKRLDPESLKAVEAPAALERAGRT